MNQAELERMLSQARALEKSRAYAQALQLYQQIVAVAPSNKLAKKRLRAVSEAMARGNTRPMPDPVVLRRIMDLYQDGRVTAALTDALQVRERFPDNSTVANMLGVIYGRLGRLDDSLAAYAHADWLDPGSHQVLSNLGNAYNRLGRNDEAIAAYRKAIELMPENPVALNGMGNALHDANRVEEAIDCYRKALGYSPDFPDALNNLGNALRDTEQLPEAIDCFARAINASPNFAQAYNNLGHTLRKMARQDEAINAFQRALAIDPDYADACNGLGNVLNDQGRHNEAIKWIRRSIELSPNRAFAHNDLGNALSDSGFHEEAVTSYHEAIRLDPAFAEVYSNLGNALAEFGDYDQAVENYGKALEIKPDFAEAHNNLSRIKTFAPDDVQLATMLSRIESGDLPDNERMHLSFALGKAYDDLGEAEKAFNYLAQGNRLRKASLGYDIGFDQRLFEAIRSTWLRLAGHEFPPPATSSAHAPLFIVGMPRSGTTLTEQILASHSQVFGAGELEAMGRLMLPLMGDGSTAGAICAARDRYLSELDELDVSESWVSDKMPANFRWVGFILKSMPNAKVINLVRDPIACCWSMFRIQFSGNGYTNDLEDLADYYLLYKDLMAFWREQFPGRIYDLDYESLTRNQETETRNLLAYCELDWEEQCLEFYKTERNIRTPSSRQVRQKMYTGSSASWRKYEQWLQPLIQKIAAAG